MTSTASKTVRVSTGIYRLFGSQPRSVVIEFDRDTIVIRGKGLRTRYLTTIENLAWQAIRAHATAEARRKKEERAARRRSRLEQT